MFGCPQCSPHLGRELNGWPALAEPQRSEARSHPSRQGMPEVILGKHCGRKDTDFRQIVAEEVQAELGATRRNESNAKDFGEWFKAWADRHPRVDHIIDDSRESIYAGCGE